jgi:hypothetical protein
MKVRVKEVEFFERDVRFRMPFKFGVITLTEEPQAFVRILLEMEGGQSGWGMAAEVLGPKWFDRNPRLSNEQNIQQLRTSLAIAAELYTLEKRFETPFGLFAKNYEPQIVTCHQQKMNPLIACYGPALLDRAILDALCRIQGASIFEALESNLAGIHPMIQTPELSGFDFEAFLAQLKPASQIHARHTVGLSDPLSEEESPFRERIDDGLPETLKEVISFYGNSYFKLKLCGKIERDLDRLESVVSVLDEIPGDYYVTLDGNEQYPGVEEVEELWGRISVSANLKRLRNAILFFEQPLNRNIALDQDVHSLSQLCPVLIDESDVDLDAFPRARYLGYRGVSSKQCKGLYKSILNRARCQVWNSNRQAEFYFMSGEDLTLQAGLAVQQDLALATFIGIEHLERNGHHYVRGMQDLPQAEQRAFLEAHPDLYVEDGDLIRLQICDGVISLGSLDCSGFASGAEPDWGKMQQVKYSADGTQNTSQLSSQSKKANSNQQYTKQGKRGNLENTVVMNPQDNWKRRARKLAISLLIIFAAAVVVVLVARIPDREIVVPEKKVVPVNVEVKTVRPIPQMADVLQLPGSLEPYRVVSVPVEEDGRISGLFSEEGQPIESGDLILKLDAALLQAEYNRAKAQADFDQRTLERSTELLERGVFNKSQIEEAEAKAAVSGAILEVAKTNL